MNTLDDLLFGLCVVVTVLVVTLMIAVSITEHIYVPPETIQQIGGF